MRPLALDIIFIYGLEMTVGQRMRRARKKLGKTQAEMAAEVGREQPTIHEWETDKSLPRTADVRKVAQAYGLRPEQLLPEVA
jgi:transcriptional regulator with XRE-family HTH domain